MGKTETGIAPLQPGDIPEKTLGFWKLAGPSAVLVGLSIGAGEIVIWPRIVAEYGASMVWAAGVGVFLQLWINLEIGRWTVATGESVYTGFCRVWGGFGAVFVLLNIMGWIAPGWGMASGLALKALLFGPDGPGSNTLWTVLTFGLVAALLFGPKLAYKSVERTIEVLVVLVTVGLVLVAFKVGTADVWTDLGKGLVNFGHREPTMSVKALFIALVFAGAGGTANLFYTFYLRDKGLGMGARIPAMENPLRGRTERTPTEGYRFPDDEENANRFRRWFRHIRIDQAIFFFGLNSITILLFIFAALAVLHPAGVIPEKGTLIWDEAVLLETIWGPTGRTIFLLVGFFTLFSTQLTILDGVARSISDIIYVNLPAARNRSLGWWYMLIAGLWMVVGCGITWVIESRILESRTTEDSLATDLEFLFNAAYMGGFAMAIYTPLLLFINLRYLPRAARPGPIHGFFMIVASITYVGFAVACLLWEFGLLPEAVPNS